MQPWSPNKAGQRYTSRSRYCVFIELPICSIPAGARPWLGDTPAPIDRSLTWQIAFVPSGPALRGCHDAFVLR